MFEHVNFDKIKGIKIWACGISNQLLDIFPYNNIAMLRFFDYKKIAGINQKANLDISYIDYPINNFSKGDNMAEADNFYTVKSGDTLQNSARISEVKSLPISISNSFEIFTANGYEIFWDFTTFKKYFASLIAS